MTGIRYRPLEFDEVPGWTTDDTNAALRPFSDCAAALEEVVNLAHTKSKFGNLCSCLRTLSIDALKICENGYDTDAGKFFFEANFRPYAIEHEDDDSLLTGYYEPILAASYVATDRFTVPVYKRPSDLVNALDDEFRGASGTGLTHFRKTTRGLEPFADRAAIEKGALDASNLELLYFEDPVEVFFLHVQGSGIAVLADGRRVRIGYDGKNGHPYTSIGRYVAKQGFMPVQSINLDTLKQWLKTDSRRAQQVMWQNKSFIFFKELGNPEDVRNRGVRNIPLTAGRSLAVDNSFHHIGLPIFVSSPKLDCLPGLQSGFGRLMIAQDAGSAITGPERGDVYYGTGDLAGAQAGLTNHHCNFFPLLPTRGLDSLLENGLC